MNDIMNCPFCGRPPKVSYSNMVGLHEGDVVKTYFKIKIQCVNCNFFIEGEDSCAYNTSDNTIKSRTHGIKDTIRIWNKRCENNNKYHRAVILTLNELIRREKDNAELGKYLSAKEDEEIYKYVHSLTEVYENEGE